MASVQQFISEWTNQLIPSRGGITGQCVSLVQRWAEENGVQGAPIFPVANASQIPHSRDDVFTWINNVPGDMNSFPQPGDIVVFSWNHTGLCVTADGNSITLFEENDLLGSGAHLKVYSYNGCVGWYRLKTTDVDIPASDGEGVVNGDHLNGHSEPNTASPSPWYFDNNEHITLVAKTQGESVTSGPYAPSSWWYLAHGNDANAQAAGFPQVWVSDSYVRTAHNPANVPDYQAPAAPPAPAAPTGRVMYDSTSASDIPADAPVVAGYVDGKYAWLEADWSRFPNADKVRIAVLAGTNDGQVLDVENGDATPQEAVGWVKMRRVSGLSAPTCYVNRGNHQAVRDAFTAAAEQEPTYWVSTLDGTKLDLGNGVVACQYAGESLSGGHYDLSTVADNWPTPAATPPPAPPPAPAPPTPAPVPPPPAKIIPVTPSPKPSLLQRLWQWLLKWLTKDLF